MHYWFHLLTKQQPFAIFLPKFVHLSSEAVIKFELQSLSFDKKLQRFAPLHICIPIQRMVKVRNVFSAHPVVKTISAKNGDLEYFDIFGPIKHIQILAGSWNLQEG